MTRRPHVLSLFSATVLAALMSTSLGPVQGKPTEADEIGGKVRVAIIGTGIAGSGTAFFLHEMLGDRVEITTFERSGEAGGRVKSVEIGGHKFEAGASIYHGSNRYFRYILTALGLEEKPDVDKGTFAVWNGHEFLFQSSEWKLVTLGRILWRWGLSLFQTQTMAERVKDEFTKVYKVQDDGKAFGRSSELWEEIGLFVQTQNQLKTSLVKNTWISEQFVDEFVAAITRVQYGQDTTMNALAGYIALVGADGNLFQTEGGNHQVPAGALKHVGTRSCFRTVVTAVEKEGTRYRVSSKPYKTEGVCEYADDNVFDVVVVAAPLEYANIGFPGISIPTAAKHHRPYQMTHTTFVIGQLSQSVFETTNGDKAGLLSHASVFTTETAGSFLSTIGVQHYLNDTTAVYKIFSRDPATEEVLGKLFVTHEAASVIRIPWPAYPVHDISHTWAPFVLEEGLYYVNGMETAVSCMETELVGARNVALLACNQITGGDDAACKKVLFDDSRTKEEV